MGQDLEGIPTLADSDPSTSERQRIAGLADEGEWYSAWSEHVGSLQMLWVPIILGAHRALYQARIAWIDEVDAMSDQQLLSVKRIGKKGLESIRAAIDIYYWRGKKRDSIDLWRKIIERLERICNCPYVKPDQRRRAEVGIAFARQVLREDGHPLAESASSRALAGGDA
jgi:hypothetical protein